jgi:hypothetical protein
VVAVELALVMPDGPADTSELVGERDGSPVGVRLAGALERPSLELRERSAPRLPNGCPWRQEKETLTVNDQPVTNCKPSSAAFIDEQLRCGPAALGSAYRVLLARGTRAEYRAVRHRGTGDPHAHPAAP